MFLEEPFEFSERFGDQITVSYICQPNIEAEWKLTKTHNDKLGTVFVGTNVEFAARMKSFQMWQTARRLTRQRKLNLFESRRNWIPVHFPKRSAHNWNRAWTDLCSTTLTNDCATLHADSTKSFRHAATLSFSTRSQSIRWRLTIAMRCRAVKFATLPLMR